VKSKEVVTPEASKSVEKKNPSKEVTADGDGFPTRKSLSTKSTKVVAPEPSKVTKVVAPEPSKAGTPETSKTIGAKNVDKKASERGVDSSSRKSASAKPTNVVTPEPSTLVIMSPTCVSVYQSF
jgi:hypothetical protein